MLEGRAVFKKNLGNRDGQKYEAWLQLNLGQKDDNGNFKQQQYHQKWNYDLEKNLAKHPSKELDDVNQKSELVKSLQKGNLQQVTYVHDNKEAKWSVEANPKDRGVNVYDENMRSNSREYARVNQSEKLKVNPSNHMDRSRRKRKA